MSNILALLIEAHRNSRTTWILESGFDYFLNWKGSRNE